MSKRICLTLDLRNNPAAIEEYKKYHEPGNVWPEIIKSIYDSGVKDMEIYCLENRMFMIMETTEDFSMENKAKMDAANEKVQEWEKLMQTKFQQALPWENKIGWVKMDRIFKLVDHAIENR